MTLLHFKWLSTDWRCWTAVCYSL